jgi:hypothetical protein
MPPTRGAKRAKGPIHFEVAQHYHPTGVVISLTGKSPVCLSSPICKNIPLLA